MPDREPLDPNDPADLELLIEYAYLGAGLRAGVPADTADWATHAACDEANCPLCAATETFDRIHLLIEQREAASPGDWETFLADDSELALRPTPQAYAASARAHIARLESELAGYKHTQDELQDELLADRTTLNQYRQVLRNAIAEALDDDNAGLTPDDPLWQTVDTFFANLIAWTPSLSGSVLELLISTITHDAELIGQLRTSSRPEGATPADGSSSGTTTSSARPLYTGALEAITSGTVPTTGPGRSTTLRSDDKPIDNH
jgi:hypothetical protein